MLFGADINSGGVGINQGQALEMNSFTGIIFLFAHSLLIASFKWGRLGPAAESVYTDSPTGSSLPLCLQAATKQITAKAHGTMLANGHKGHQISVGLGLSIPL